MYVFKQGFRSEVIEYFKTEVLVVSENISGFVYKNDVGQRIDIEYFGSEKWQVPSVYGFWEVCKCWDKEVRELYIFSSAIEALAFFHLHYDKLLVNDALAIVSVGLIASKMQVHYLKGKYSNAKLHLVLGNNTLDRIADCRFAVWLKKKNVQFVMTLEGVKLNFLHHCHKLPIANLSLFSFKKLTGIRSGIRTHKPPKDFESFYHQFTSINHI